MNRGQTHMLQAILLLGPTGSGKTPLGGWLGRNGLWERPCRHFDFGANLRAVVAAGPSDAFTREEIEFLQRVLTQGLLLENESFHLAARILDGFVAQRGVRPGDWLVLNGLPRHVGQAQALEQQLRVCALVQLKCDTRVVRERLRRNAGGDRSTRTDDDEELLACKLAIYAERTQLLVAHYCQRGARLLEVAVHVGTQPEEIGQRLEEFDAVP
jgi:adenylate kinase